MQPVNDDMDHLFRQAADNYPLKTQGADFDKLQQRMATANDEAPFPKESRQRYKWLLLLLLAFPFVCRHYYLPTPEPGIQIPKGKKLVQQSTSSFEKDSAITKSTNTTPAPIAESTDNDTALKNNSITKITGPYTSFASTNGVAAKQQTSNAGGNFSSKKSNQVVDEKDESNSETHANRTSTKTQNYKSINARRRSKEYNIAAADVAGKSESKISTTTNPLEEEALIKDSSLIIDKRDSSNLNSNTDIPSKITDTTNAITANKATAKDSASLDSSTLVKRQPEKRRMAKPHFYLGLIAGLDYSTVKSVQTAGTGYSTGLIVGRRFGRHLAVETGLLWNYKKYYSDGQYVSTEKLGLLPHTQVLNANGSCGMFEIPLTVQYHFSSNSSGHWYASTGVSTYLMRNEEYYYTGKRYNNIYYSEKKYYNATQDWFSVLQISGGYQWQLGKRGSLRAEPYFKLPISKIGIARLPLSSAGINVGYTIPF